MIGGGVVASIGIVTGGGSLLDAAVAAMIRGGDIDNDDGDAVAVAACDVSNGG